MTARFFVATPSNFSFRHTVYSHGWSELPPFELDDQQWALTYVFMAARDQPVTAKVIEQDKGLQINVFGKTDEADAVRNLRHILRLDDPLEEFYLMARGDQRISWAAEANAGRLLRSPSVFEDLVKTLCTTNCSWSLTRKMVTNLVEKLGMAAPDGRRAFPSAAAMAAVPEAFYRDEIRAGYRSPYFAELAESVAAGKLDPESWLQSELPSLELKKEIKKVKGIGDYAAENLLKLLGRYDGLALDSWLRAEFYKKHNHAKPCPDSKIERHYRKFGDWKGLAIWCDMTERWFDGKI